MNFKKVLLLGASFVALLAACKKNDSGSNNNNNNLCPNGLYTYMADSFLVAIPTAFTPNGDGKNDELRLIISEPDSITGFHFSITDRTGATVYETTNVHAAWDGYIKGKRADDYNYSANLTYIHAGKTESVCSYIFCLRMDANNCPIAVLKDVSKYRFEDQFDIYSGYTYFPTGESFCTEQ